MSINGSHPYFYSNNLYGSLHHICTLSMIKFNDTSLSNLKPSFILSYFITSSIKWYAAILSLIKKNSNYNEHNTQALFVSGKTHNVGSPYTGFLIIPTFVRPVVTSRGPYSDPLNNLS